MQLKKHIHKIYLIAAVLIFFSKTVIATETEFSYSIKDVQEVYLIWGVNDWQLYEKQLPNTTVKDKTMRTMMVRNGDEYVARLDVDSGNIINFAFMVVKRKGPFNARVEYWDLDDNESTKGYFAKSDEGRRIKIIADPARIEAKGGISMSKYAKYLCLFFLLSSISFFFIRKYYFKKPAYPFSQVGYFVSLTGALALLLFFIRASVAGLLLQFMFEPLSALWQMFGAAWDDMKYVAILFVVFGLLFWGLKKIRRTILVTYSIVVFLSVLIALINTKLMTMLGRPFNYQWLYYSGFLKSKDASLVFSANVNTQFIAGIVLMLVTVSAICLLLYQVYVRKNLPVVLVLPVLFLIALTAQFTTTVPPLKAANPVLYFAESAYWADASSVINKKFAGKSDFENKNTDSLPPKYDSLFGQNKIKNVVFLVLESTPWEYVAPYNSNIKATPFIDEYKNKAVFENIYAHIPSTNKSMFSFLCAAYPELSYKSLTMENPDIPLPSIPSELKKSGYRSAFINSGDNGYLNAGGFLKARGFDIVQDFHESPCSDNVFKDKRYSDYQLDGVDDSCLSVRLFNWIGKDTSSPFFAMLWTFQTHYPYFTSGEIKDYKTGNPSLEKYLNALHRADETLKDIVKGLEQRGLLESTLIVISGDHGEAFGRHGQTTHAAAAYEENLHVPFILMNPSLFNGERLDAAGGTSDIAPTIFSILNKPVPAIWQGENLFSINRRKRVYFFNPYSDYLFGVRDGNRKLIFNATDNTYKVFDLVKDPRETNDISRENPAFVKEAGEKLQSWMYYQDQYMKKTMVPETIKSSKK